MANHVATVPGSGVRTLNASAGTVIDGVESDFTLAAGDSISYQNNGDCILKLKITTAGTGTIVALNSANNQALTLAIGTLLLPPLDPAIFGSTVSITTATAVGTGALYRVAQRLPNALHNPFELVISAVDA